MPKLRVVAFDVDDSLAIGPRPGPIPIQMLWDLLGTEEYIIGICGNHKIFMKHVPQWWRLVSFFGGHPPLGGYKPTFLNEIKQSIWLGNPQITDYLLVGNSKAEALSGTAGPSANDDGAARLASWRFVSAQDFASGAR